MELSSTTMEEEDAKDIIMCRLQGVREGKRRIDKVYRTGGMGKYERLPGLQKFNAISNGYCLWAKYVTGTRG